MKTRIRVTPVEKGRSTRRATTIGTLVGTRFQEPLLSAIDGWRKEQPDLPTRPEAVRRLVELGMARGLPNPVPHKKGESSRDR